MENDLISRQAAILQLSHNKCGNDENDIAVEHDIETIIALPSAQPEQWIPCSEKMPEEAYGCLVTVMDTNPATIEDFPNLLPYFVGYDGEQWNDADGDQCPFEVIAWMPLPEPYQEERREDE